MNFLIFRDFFLNFFEFIWIYFISILRITKFFLSCVDVAPNACVCVHACVSFVG